MNERLEQLAFQIFPEIWEPIGNNILGYERDINYEQRQKWLEDAKKIYNLALADVRKETEERRDFMYARYIKNGIGCIEESRYDQCVELLHFIDNLTK